MINIKIDGEELVKKIKKIIKQKDTIKFQLARIIAKKQLERKARKKVTFNKNIKETK